MPNKDRDKARSDYDLDKELDRELEGTFPASDPLKVTRPRTKAPYKEKPESRAAERK